MPQPLKVIGVGAVVGTVALGTLAFVVTARSFAVALLFLGAP